MQVNKEGVGSFACSQALVAYRRVVRDATYGLAYAGPEDKELGTLKQRHIVSGLGASAYASVVFANAQGTCKMVAAGGLSAWDLVYGAEDGKVDDTPNGNPIGLALEDATNDGDYIEVLRLPGLRAASADQVGGLELFDDFIGDYPAAATGINWGWTKTETNGLGVTSSDEANGVLKFAADAVTEAACANLFHENAAFDVDQNPIFEAKLAIFDIGDDAAVDFDFGLASDDHGTDFESIAAFAAFHLDGTDLSLKAHSDDGASDVAAVDSAVDLVDDTYYEFRIDVTDKTDVKFYYRALGANTWTRICSSTTFTLSNYTGTLSPIIMVEKTSDNSTFDLRADWVRVRGERA